jgi:hypothetical protein
MTTFVPPKRPRKVKPPLESASRSQVRWIVGALGLAVVAASAWYIARLPRENVRPLQRAFDHQLPLGEVVERATARNVTISTPAGWNPVQLSEGVTSYAPPASEAVTVEPEVLPGSNGIDGTRHPYLAELRVADLRANRVAPGKYVWKTTWEGEGYDRELTGIGRLVSARERGDDIFVTVSYDTTIKDPKQPNLTITIQSTQNETGQLTNISAFRIDRETGATLERRDFGQLTPIYDVTVTRNGGFGGTEIKKLDRLGTTTFAYHIPEGNMQAVFPLKIQGDNTFFNDRLWEIYNLEQQGWVIREVPAPSGATS